MVSFSDDVIYIQEWSPARVLEINTAVGTALWWDGELNITQNIRGGDDYSINSRTMHSTKPTQNEINMGFGKALCCLNSRMKAGF